DENVILYKDEVRMAKKVLTAAAMTYVAAMFSALMSLLRLILLSNRGRRR
ncbi:MAG: zinc metallopeptidase, partial [Ruminococcus sp.]|nr:zinc metallopeptidase [Ruminococcus sp.]